MPVAARVRAASFWFKHRPGLVLGRSWRSRWSWRGGPVGVLDSYRARPHLWDDSEMTAVQAFAGVLGNLLSALAAAQASGRLAEQLQYALEHRGCVEQAKGVLMSRHGLEEATAFERLRRTARSTRQTVDGVAREVIAKAVVDGRGKQDRSLSEALAAHRAAGRRAQQVPPGAVRRYPHQGGMPPAGQATHGPGWCCITVRGDQGGFETAAEGGAG